MKRFKKLISILVAGAFLVGPAFGATKLHKDLTGTDLHVCKLHASTHATGGTDAVTITASSQLSGAVPIANGGTNASSFATSNALTKYNGTSVVSSGVVEDATGGVDFTSGNVTYVPAGLNATQLNAYIAASQAGDTLVLASGSYTINASILLDKAVFLKGQGKGKTTLAAGANALVGIVQMYAANTRLEGVSITGAAAGLTYGVYSTGSNLTGIKIKDVSVSLNGSNVQRGIVCADVDAEIIGCDSTVVSSDNIADAIFARTTETANATRTVKVYNSTGSATSSTTASAFASDDSSATQDSVLNTYDCYGSATGSTNGYGVQTTTGSNGKANIYGGRLSGSTYDAAIVSGGTLTISNCTLANNTTSGTITYRSWTAWTPTLTWTTGTPASITRVSRYTITDGICKFSMYLTSADGNGATALTATLPVTPKDIDGYHAITANQLVDTTWSKPAAYIDASDNTAGNRMLKFHNLSTATDDKTITLEVSGEYEI